MRTGRWVQRHNRYRINVAEKIARETIAGGPGFAPRHMRAYVVASAPLHAADGWSYLGRSISAQLCGDTAAGIHLAYYAELRAAMSLLAAGGIGVLRRKHFVIKASGECVLVPSGPPTHDMVWESLRIWAGGADASDIVGNAITPAGTPIADWITGHPGLAGWRPLAVDWLLSWGVDIRDYTADQIARNTASYRPSRLGGPRLPPADAVRDAVVSLWSLLEPGDSPFALLDKSLLRLAIKEGRRASGLRRRMRTIAEELVQRAAVPPESARNLADFLATDETPRLLIDAGLSSPIWAASHIRQMTSRATLLLRVATGAATDMLQRARILPDELSFWREDVGTSHGYWQPGAPPRPLTDLWADVEAALLDVDSQAITSYADLRAAISGDSALSEVGRAGLWGLHPS